MSETNGFAKKDSLAGRKSKRRIADYQWADVGKLILQSPLAGEWIRIESARDRATMAAMSGRKRDHEIASQDFALQVLYSIPLDEHHNPFFAPDDKDLILGLDSGLVDPLVAACVKHANLDAGNLVEGAEKNLPGTSGDGSPSGSGST